MKLPLPGKNLWDIHTHHLNFILFILFSFIPRVIVLILYYILCIYYLYCRSPNSFYLYMYVFCLYMYFVQSFHAVHMCLIVSLSIHHFMLLYVLNFWYIESFHAVSTLRLRQNGHHFCIQNFQIFMNENILVLIQISLKSVPEFLV